MARYELGTTVYTNDNINIGTIDRLIVDPRNSQLQGFVVRKGLILQRDVVISVGDAVPDDFDDMNGIIHLTVSRDDTDRMLAFQEDAYGRPPDAVRQTGVLWPAPIYYADPYAKPHPEEQHAAHRRIEQMHPASTFLRTGTKVVGRDGTKIGTVSELVADTRTGTISELVATKGLVDLGEVRIPVQLIDAVTDDIVYVALDGERAEQYTYP